jgi:uncharacterized membrane protein
VKAADLKLFETYTDAQELLYKQNITNGFFPENPEDIRKFYTIITVLAFISGNIGLFIIAITFGRVMPRKTIGGSEAAGRARSLRRFLTSQEKQLAYQAKAQLLFEKLLPYAVAFGVERIWAARFKDINIRPPDWFQSSNTGTMRHFSTALFVGSLNHSFSAVRYTPTHTRSTSGFSSGFSSGGGFSGGGGGGGGGGSW